MATTTTTLRLGTTGIVGTTQFVAAEISADTDADAGSAYAVTGAQNVEITLPTTPRSGDVIIVKNLLTDQVAPTPNFTITIDRNGHMIDGTTNPITSNTRNDRWELIYINATVGWLVI